MLILLLVVGMLAIGGAIGRWWTLWLPVVVVAVLAGRLALSGYLWDAPLPFVLLVAEIAVAFGVFTRRHMAMPR